MPPADHRDRDAARTIACHPEQGWSLLCNGVIVFDDLGEILPGGLVMRDGDGVLTVIAFTIDAGRITAMDVMRNPDKLTTVPDPG